MTTYYIHRQYDRSANAMRDGKTNIDLYLLRKEDHSTDKNFDRWADSGESMEQEFDAIDDDAAINVFEQYISENNPNHASVDYEDYYNIDVIAAACVGSAPEDNLFYTLRDPDGITNDDQACWPDFTAGTEVLCGADTGGTNYIYDCQWFDEFLTLPVFRAAAYDIARKSHWSMEDDTDDEIDLTDKSIWSDVMPGTDAADTLVEILESNGYITETCQSPGHLDSGTPGGCGNGALYDYILIRKH